MRTGTLTLSIDSRPDHVFLVGLTVNKICAAIPLSEEEACQAELCVVEAVNNCIEHAYRQQSGHVVEVVVLLERKRLTFKVCDSGEPMRRDLCARQGGADGLAEGGRGLFIMRTLMDQVSYGRLDGKNVLTLVKEFDGKRE